MLTSLRLKDLEYRWNWPLLTLKLQAKDYELTFPSKVKTKVFSKLNTIDLSLV